MRNTHVTKRKLQYRPRRMDHGEHNLSGVFEERQAHVGSPFCDCQIIITAVQVYKQVWAGSYALHACMCRRADCAQEQLFLATILKLLIIKKSHQQQEN